jgi:FkbM family methyltransferase
MLSKPTRRLFSLQSCKNFPAQYIASKSLKKLKRQARIFLGKDIRQKIQTTCSTERYGSVYGGWSVCPNYIDANSIVYSFGVGEDASFDIALIAKFSVNVFAFDPTPKSINWVKEQNLSAKFKMHPYGIASFDGEIQFYPPENPEHVSHTILPREATKNKAITVPVFRLLTIMRELGHKQIDVLKMDIEGAEYDVIVDIIKSNIAVDQILVEFHHRSHVAVSKTREAIHRLNCAGYSIFAISDSGDEYSFINDKLSQQRTIKSVKKYSGEQR